MADGGLTRGNVNRPGAQEEGNFRYRMVRDVRDSAEYPTGGQQRRSEDGGSLRHSIVMAADDYLRAAAPGLTGAFSTEA